MMHRDQHGGFIKLIILLVIVLIVLGYFGFNIQQIINSPTVSGNLSYVWNLALNFWNNFLVVPVTYVWNKIIVGFFWNTFAGMIEKIQSAPPPSGGLPLLNQ